jgi:hypothetical protein
VSDTYKVTYEVTGEVKPGAISITSRKDLVTPEGYHVTAVNLRHARAGGMEDDEAIRRILAIAYPWGTVEPDQIVVHEKEEI